jgi:uncharacterized membrane protein
MLDVIDTHRFAAVEISVFLGGVIGMAARLEAHKRRADENKAFANHHVRIAELRSIVSFFFEGQVCAMTMAVAQTPSWRDTSR